MIKRVYDWTGTLQSLIKFDWNLIVHHLIHYHSHVETNCAIICIWKVYKNQNCFDENNIFFRNFFFYFPPTLWHIPLETYIRLVPVETRKISLLNASVLCSTPFKWTSGLSTFSSILNNHSSLSKTHFIRVKLI